ncbi:hypothetical protein CUMW_176300 [Citrus unshiu]|uniref:Subtilisin-like protease fibronectin type-III domain-containing protein n=1 Tax=Citrus unshiu TaxID=55188 RepID=A0A2H5PXF0_CITUN|nr:hypothetical protein CUMW_176300 [Citrus unshiu]
MLALGLEPPEVVTSLRRSSQTIKDKRLFKVARDLKALNNGGQVQRKKKKMSKNSQDSDTPKLGKKIIQHLQLDYRKREAEILTTEAIKDSHVPVVPGFSSRGPNEIAPDILKRLGNFTILSGIFVSCPHAAGVAAYVKSFHPDWSPSAIQSAIMTTAVNPGLVYETFEQDYIIMLCNIGYDEGNIGKISGKISTCLKGSDKATPKDLNYSSMAAQVSLGKSFAINFPRTVTNVGLANSIYKAKILQNSKIFSIKVVPEALSFRSLNEKKSFSVTVTGKGLPNGAIVSAS